MASPQLENGHTRIANELLEALCSYSFPPKASLPPRIVLFVIRKTYGFQKKMDTLSISQFQEGVGEKNRSNLIYWLNYLVQARILVKDKVSNMQVKYGLNKNYSEWLPLVQVKKLVQVRSWGSASTSTKTSARTRTHKRNKEIYTKEITSTEQGSGDSRSVIHLFRELNPSYEILYKRKPQHDAARRLLEKQGIDRISKALAFIASRKEDRYCPVVTTPIQLEEKWGQLEKYGAGLKKSNEPNWKVWN